MSVGSQTKPVRYARYNIDILLSFMGLQTPVLSLFDEKTKNALPYGSQNSSNCSVLAISDLGAKHDFEIWAFKAGLFFGHVSDL